MKLFLHLKMLWSDFCLTCYEVYNGIAPLSSIPMFIANYITYPVCEYALLKAYSFLVFIWTKVSDLFGSYFSEIFLLSINFWNFIFMIVFSLKFIMLISLLVFVRGGIPRYRYDYLTKIGWLRLLSLTVAFFLISLILCFIMW